MQRLDRASAAVANALRALPVAGDPGHMPAGDVAAGVATILRKRLGPCERLTVASAAMLSLDPDSRDTLIRTAERGRKAEQVFRRVGYRHHRHPVARHG